MVWKDCGGRECKVGWGYNESLDLPIEFKEGSANIKKFDKIDWQYFVYNLSANSIPYFNTVNYIISSKSQRFLDFQIVLDNEEYWQVECHIIKRREGCKKYTSYPLKSSHFIRWIDLGMDFWLQFPKSKFPSDPEELKALFKERKFDEEQKKVNCKVLINYESIKEQTLGEVLMYMTELEVSNSDSYIPIRFDYLKLDQEMREITVNNQNQFALFLTYLYIVCRKIEMKMDQVGYSNIIETTTGNVESSVKMCANLDKTKKEYKAMERKDFLKMYPTLKTLFNNYITYIKYLMDQRDDIDDGDNLPGNADELRDWLGKLDNWVPIKSGEEWISPVGSFIDSNHQLGEPMEIQ